jgi:hypothetical protein
MSWMRQMADDHYEEMKAAKTRITALERELAAERERTRWIPVTERLPEEDGFLKKLEAATSEGFTFYAFYDAGFFAWGRKFSPLPDVAFWRRASFPPVPVEQDHSVNTNKKVVEQDHIVEPNKMIEQED